MRFVNNKIVVFAQTPDFKKLCFNRVLRNFQIAQNCALDYFADRLGAPRMSSCRKGYFLAKFPAFHFEKDNEKANSELLTCLFKEKDDVKALDKTEVEETIQKARDLVDGHSSVSTKEVIFFEALGNIQDEYHEADGGVLNIYNLIRKEDTKKYFLDVWETAFHTSLNEKTPLVIKPEYLVNFGLRSIPANLTFEDWQSILKANLENRDKVGDTGSVFVVSDDEKRLKIARNNGFATYVLDNENFDPDDLLHEIHHYLFVKYDAGGDTAPGKGRGFAAQNKFSSPSI